MARKGKVLFIDAREELKQEKTISYLLPEHINKIHKAFSDFQSIDGFTYIAEDSEILEKDSSLNIPLYIKDINIQKTDEPTVAYKKWNESSQKHKKAMNALFEVLK